MQNFMKNKSTKKKEGITLIALVITVIVLLILAAISITMLTGDNGILQRATQSKEKTERAEIVENAKMDILGKIAEKRGNNLTEDEIEEILTKYGTLSNNGESTILNKILTSTKGYEIAVSEIYSGSLAEKVDTGYGLYDYETGLLKKSWSKLLKEGIISVDENGVISTKYSNYKNESSDTLDGKLVIADNVKSLSDNSFNYCEKLKEVVLPENILTIGNDAFSCCKMLEKINIPNQVTSVGNRTFYRCYALENIEIPNSITKIPKYMFLECNNLKSVILPDNLTTIGRAAFSSTHLKEISLPSNITCIEASAFEQCDFTNIILPNGITEIADCTFRYCSKLTNIVIPENVTSIGQGAFYDSGLTEIILPENVTTVGNQAFYNAYLVSATIKGNVSFKGTNVFNCNTPYQPLKNITLGSDDTQKGMKTISETLIPGMFSLTNIVLKDSITSIDNGAFSGCMVNNITLPKNVTTVKSAFGDWNSSRIINVSRYSSQSEATGYSNGWSGNATVKWKGEF